jgi:hypothetical protein
MNSHALRVVSAIVAATVLALCGQLAGASTIPGEPSTSTMSDMSLYSGSKLVVGASASVLQLDVPTAGVLSLTWTVLDFSSSLADLDVQLSNGLKSMGNYQTDGSTTLDLTGPVNLYMTIFASAQGNMDVGLYHVSAMFVPATAAVPLPRLGVFGLGAGLIGIFALGWRRRNGEPALSPV